MSWSIQHAAYIWFPLEKAFVEGGLNEVMIRLCH